MFTQSCMHQHPIITFHLSLLLRKCSNTIVVQIFPHFGFVVVKTGPGHLQNVVYNYIVAGTYNVQCHGVNQPHPIATLLATIRILHINSLLLHLHQRSALTLSLHLDVCAAKRSHCTPVRAKRSSSRRLSCGAKLHLS